MAINEIIAEVIKSNILEVRNSMFKNLNKKYNEDLLVGKKEDILSHYKELEEKLYNLRYSDDPKKIWLLNNSKKCFERCKPYIAKLKKTKKLAAGENISLGYELASAVAGYKLLVKDSQFVEYAMYLNLLKE